jgi:hypothetical protein
MTRKQMSLQNEPANVSSRDENSGEDPQIERDHDAFDSIEDGEDDQPGDRRRDPLRWP